MAYKIDLTDILVAVVQYLPKEQVAPVCCYLGTVGAGLIAYKMKLDHDHRMAALNAA